MLLASLIAASCGVQVEAGSSQPKSDGINRPIKIQTQMESDVIPASCNCDNSSAASSCDLCDPMKFGCDSCGDGSCDSFGGCDGLGSCGCDSGLLGLGILKKSEHCYDDFISPMTNPVYFEDPRQLTELRGIFINHKIPALLGPLGEVRVYALQVRARLTERLSLIAVKDGYIESESPLMQDGWADVSAGLKYSLYRDPTCGRLLSGGIRYETYAGRRRTLQGNGNGVFDIFLTGGSRLGQCSHILSAAGFILPVDSNSENQMFYWSTHLDRRITKKAYAFTEFNWYNYMKDANAFGLPVEGGDLFNLGSPGIAGNNLVTNAYGLKFKPRSNIEAGTAFEFPLTERRGILDNRITADLIIRY